jgi:beta-N-acetylhexosaminidase
VVVELPLWQQLTAREQVAQLLALPITVTSNVGGLSALNSSEELPTISSDIDWISDHQPGFVTLFGRNISTESATLQVSQIREVSPASGLPIWIAVDHEGGEVQRLSGSGFLRLPAWRELCASGPLQREAVLSQSAAELAEIGVDVVFAPVVDLANYNPVLTNRICSSDPSLVTAAASSFVEVFSRTGILPVIKHFPGIGSTKQDLHRSFDRVTVTTTEVMVYRQLLDRAPRTGVMVSHVGVENQFPNIPCSLSPECVQELRVNYPTVLVFSDALEMPSALYRAPDVGSLVASSRTLPEAALAAILAGNDVLVFGEGVPFTDLIEVLDYLEAEMRTNDQLRGRVEASLGKIVQYKQNALPNSY